ncbi:hypothetical protein NC661_08995 [Aquibacillus koreensis]|uniref:Uncharacterized protein n=1 Tax=Aquibacillus koreensis TaxID=279446 RepID=A0A9X3WLL7_9BACI|nr:hypothetical protein [Aquibacillus koreensis]MCT2536046.1 hypothetical protein [Aquibacillus koreensis]MDC3420501.1 hypothetical protein [Aquibacillus koreensis]
MLKRKLLTLIFATLLSISLLASWFVLTEGEELIAFFPMALFVSWIAIPAILLYGLPVSFLSEKLTKQFANRQRICWSLVIHVIFGIGFIFFIGLLFETQTVLTDFNQFWRSYGIIFMASILTSVCFWGVDESLRYCSILKSTNH